VFRLVGVRCRFRERTDVLVNHAHINECRSWYYCRIAILMTQRTSMQIVKDSRNVNRILRMSFRVMRSLLSQHQKSVVNAISADVLLHLFLSCYACLKNKTFFASPKTIIQSSHTVYVSAVSTQSNKTSTCYLLPMTGRPLDIEVQLPSQRVTDVHDAQQTASFARLMQVNR